ncbi:hypothetical protein MHK_001196, partial [Candidatus Magnetomorum sp. HK-1]
GGTYGGLNMFEDPIVNEIRAARQKHAAKFNFDLKKIAQDLREKQKKSKRKVVSYSPKPARP